MIARSWAPQRGILGLLWLAFFPAWAASSVQSDRSPRAYSFVYLGDLHFDRTSHHDLDWVRRTQPDDLRQIEGYVRNTEEHTPQLLRRIQAMIDTPEKQIQMVIQAGDLTEGLCGSQALQERQFSETIACIRQYIPKTPFLMVKGNHDITGPGAREAFDTVMLPWLSNQCGAKLDSASFSFMKGPDLYVFFDAYHANDLGWLERTLGESRHRFVFVVMHPPAVPYTARATWHLFSRDKEEDRRTQFVNLLGHHRAILLTAHLHKHSVLVRKTQTGRFVQVSMSSVIDSPHICVKNRIEGIESYGRSLVELEPTFERVTKERRQQILDEEKPAIAHFECAEVPGYALIRVTDEGVDMASYLGHSDNVWKRLSLSYLLN